LSEPELWELSELLEFLEISLSIPLLFPRYGFKLFPRYGFKLFPRYG
jgi:hypothetical protein